MGLRNKLRKAFDAGFNDGYHGTAVDARFRYAEKRRDHYVAGYEAGAAKARERGVLFNVNGVPGMMSDYNVVSNNGTVRIKRGSHADREPRLIPIGFWPGFRTPAVQGTGRMEGTAPMK